MKAKKRKALSLRQAAKTISENIWDFLKTLPPEERDRRLEKFHKSVQAKMARAKASASYANTHQRLEERNTKIFI